MELATAIIISLVLLNIAIAVIAVIDRMEKRRPIHYEDLLKADRVRIMREALEVHRNRERK
jgi:hypothetical protein